MPGLQVAMMIALAAGNPERAARFAGAMSVLREQGEARLTTTELLKVDDPAEQAQRVLGEETFATALEAGRSLTTDTPLWGLGEYSRATGDARGATAAERAVEFFLDHHLFRSESTGRVINEKWLKLHYPLYWHYDILHGALILTRLGRAKDPRMRETLDIIERKRDDDGCWRPEGYYWRPLRSAGSNIEIVDWGRGARNEMITLNALRVLVAAGRL